MSIPLLSTLIFFPILGGLSLLVIPRQQTATIRTMALLISLIELCLTLPVALMFDKSTASMQFVENHPWIASLHINYTLGIDGISVLFLLLTGVIIVLSILVSWESITTKVQEFFIAMLLLEGAMMGVFCATDLFLFYIFWEAMLIPMILIIGIWGGPNRI